MMTAASQSYVRLECHIPFLQANERELTGQNDRCFVVCTRLQDLGLEHMLYHNSDPKDGFLFPYFTRMQIPYRLKIKIDPSTGPQYLTVRMQ